MKTEKETLYIIDVTNYKGNICHSIFKGEDKLHYCNESWAEEQKRNPNLKALTWDEYYSEWYAPYLTGLCKEWKEISEEEYYDMLECLPPLRWHDLEKTADHKINIFFNSEMLTAHLSGAYIYIKTKDGIKYYSATRSTLDSDAVLLNDIKKHFNLK